MKLYTVNLNYTETLFGKPRKRQRVSTVKATDLADAQRKLAKRYDNAAINILIDMKEVAPA